MSENNRLKSRIRWCEGIIEWGTISLVVYAPLAFGAVETWAWSGIAVGCCIIAAAERYRRTLLPRSPDIAVPRPAAYYGFLVSAAVFFLCALFQVIPLPLSLIDSISPGTAKYWLLSGRAGGQSWATLSLYPALSAAEVIKLAAYALIFLTLMNYRPLAGSQKIFATRLITAVIVTGFAISVIGILQKYSWAGKIYWLRPIRFGSPFGPFVNRNHFAGYIVMVIPLALGLFLSLPTARGGGLRERLASADPRRWLLAFVVLVMILALFLSLSRGGIAAGLLALVFFIALARRWRLLSFRRVFPAFGAGTLLLTAVLLYLGPGTLIKRFEAVVTGETEQDVRLTLWGDTWRIYRDFPVTGTGLGTFVRIYPHYKSFIWKIPYTHAENDYLQVAAELGIGGVAGLAGLLGSIFWLVLSWKPRFPRPPSPVAGHGDTTGWVISGRALVAGCSAGALALLLQSVVNFNFSIPANALLLTVLAALVVGRVSPEG